MRDSFEQLVEECMQLPVEGWDFSVLGERLQHAPLPWDYRDRVRSFLPVDSLLDQGTGGGEMLSSLAPLPYLTIATESWGPNVAVAAARLREFSVHVVQTESLWDNSESASEENPPLLPFRSAAFDLVINSHESFVGSEVERVLRSGGHFVTQQVDPSGDAFFTALFGATQTDSPVWDSGAASRQLTRAGLEILDVLEGDQTLTIRDVGALVWYLRAVPWTIEDFSLQTHETHLREIHRSMALEPLVAPQPRFLITCRKP